MAINYAGIRLKEQPPSGLLLVSMPEGKMVVEELTGQAGDLAQTCYTGHFPQFIPQN